LPFAADSQSSFLQADVKKKKCLIVELWWIGDAVLMTAVLQGLLADGWEVTVLGKAQARRLLEGTYPQVKWIIFDAPWTAFRGKYRLWRYPWRTIARVLLEVRRGQFDAAVSIRHDPRDQFLLWLARVPRRIGFRAPFGSRFLNEIIPPPPQPGHRVEDWWLAQAKVSPTAQSLFPPRLMPDPEPAEKYRALYARDPRPVLALHCGARNLVRRWPARYLHELISALRAEFNFQLALFPDVDGYGGELADLADHTFTGLGLDELAAALAGARVFIGNDSGPGHLADSLGVHIITIFGPGDPTMMRPFADRNLLVIRDICPYHPCSDYCRFPEPYCLTQLTPAIVLRDVRAYLLKTGLLATPSASAAAAVSSPVH
jgi:ADP-heptose:LPS heptosyltransferase